MKLPSPKTDNQHTLLLLIQRNSLTSIELRQLTKSSYPPARIRNLKECEISIISKKEPYVNRRGERSTIARYILATPKREAIKIYKQMAA